MKNSLFFLALLILSISGFAQTVKELNIQIFELSEKGEFEKAIPFAEKAIQKVKNELGETHSSYAKSLNILAGLNVSMKQYDKAELLYIKSMAIQKKASGENYPGFTIDLIDLAFVYQSIHKYDKAEFLYKQAKEIDKKVYGETHKYYASDLNNLAFLYEIMGEYEKAEPLYIEEIEIWKKKVGQAEPQYATSLYNLGFLYQRMSIYAKAESFYIKAKDIRKKFFGEFHHDYAASIASLAFLYKSMNEYNKAMPLYIEAKEIVKKNKGENDPDYASSLNNLGGLYNIMGQYEKAEPLFIEAKEIWKKVLGETHPDYARSLNNLAALYKSTGHYEKAERLFIEAKEIWKKGMGETPQDYAMSLNNLGTLYQDLGQYEKAETLFLQANQIDKKVLEGTSKEYARDLNNLAELYRALGQYAKAEPLYNKANEINKKVLGENDPGFATDLNNLAGLYGKTGQYLKAELLYIQAKDIRKKVFGETHTDYANSLNNIACFYQNIGQHEKAEPLFIQAMEINKNLLGENHPDYAMNIGNLSALYESMGNYKKAELLILKNSQITLDNLRDHFTILSEKEKGNYLANNISMVETNNSLQYNYKKASSGLLINNFNLQLFLKSLSLADTRSVLESVSNSKDESIKILFKEWQANKSLLAKQYSLPFNNRMQKLDSFEAKTETLEKELTSKSSEFRTQEKAISISIPHIQKNLQQDEAAIEFVKFHLYNKKWTDSTLYVAYILRKNDSVPVFVTLCEEKQLQQLFDSAGTSATTMVNTFYRGLDLGNSNNSNFLGTELYKLIWEPLEPYLKGIKKVSYSPAGKLFSVAFQALSVDSNTVLMDKYDLQQYTSTRQVALRTEEKEKIKPTSITLFGNASFTMDSLQLVKQNPVTAEKITTSIYTPTNRGNNNSSWSALPGTAEEVKKIKALFEENKIVTKTFVQTTASEENLKALSGNSPQVLHIATHGFFLPDPEKKKREMSFGNENTYTLADDPLLRSGLILAGGNYAWSGKTPIEGVEDGIATAYEISQLNLSNTELVVLSACETALGDVKGSEGVFGLQRAFKMAGVKKMIVSLWQVPDKETAELMTAFYAYWMKGRTIEESFSQAQADMRKKYSPFYWAAFVLVE